MPDMHSRSRTRIRAAVLRQPGGPLSLEALELDAPRADEILVRMVAAGICHTDLRAMEGAIVPLPVVLGHEGAGIVEAVGSGVSGFQRGDPMLLTFESCGQCPSCRRPAPAYCYELLPRNFGARRTDGSSALADASGAAVCGRFFGQSSFATYALCTARNAVRCPPGLPLDLLAPLGCGIQTGAGAVLRSLEVRAGESIAIFGTGSVGLAAVMAARIAGANPIIAIDTLEERLQLARDLGATHAIRAGGSSVRDAVLEITKHGVQHAFDTSGVGAVIEDAIGCLAPLGKCGLVAPSETPHVRFAARYLLTGGRTIRGICEGDSVPAEFIPQLAGWFAEGRLPLERLVQFYPFERINEAIADARSGRAIKPVLRFA